MLIPYKDDNPTSRFPIITVILILTNIAVFLYALSGKIGFAEFTNQYGLIPSEFLSGKNLPSSDMINPYLTVISYMFLHGGVLHIVFNMLFLWIFGNNIEDRMSPIRFIIFYLLIGIISGIVFAVTSGSINMPLVGASGAISGILGAYLFLFPFARIRTLFFIIRVRMPAIVFIVIWFATQILNVLGTGSESNVAWTAHISGFIAGIILFKFFTVRRRRSKDIINVHYY